jgi:AcrR family transcriptional regulator
VRSLGSASSLTDARIVEVALESFTRKGFHGTSTRELALQVGCSVSTIYDHFASKEAILVRIIDDIVRDLNACVSTALEGEDSRPSAQLRAAVYAHVALHCERPQQTFIAATEIRSLGAANRDIYMKERDEYEGRFREIVLRGIAEGEFFTPYPAEATRAILAISTGVAGWFRASGQLSISEVAHHHADMALAIARAGSSVQTDAEAALAGSAVAEGGS